jgi:hypothetical protein
MEEQVRIDRCNNIGDFRSIARRRLPGPIFHYIDGAADDEVTYRRNTEAYEQCDLVPNVLAGIVTLTRLPRKNVRRSRLSRRLRHGIPPVHCFSSELAQCSSRDQMALDVKGVVDRGMC